MPKNKGTFEDEVDEVIEGEEKKETPKEEIKETPVEVDTSAIKEEVTKEVTETVAKETIDKLVSALRPEEKEQTPWEKEGRNPTYKEALDWVADKNFNRLKEEQAKEKTKEEEDRKAQETISKENEAAWNRAWDKQLDDLRKDGKLPEVKDRKDPEDEGVKAEKKLFEMALEGAKDNPDYLNLKVVYYEKYQNNEEVPGGNAPVIGSSKASGGSNDKSFTYEEIHNTKSLEDIVS